MADSRSPAPPAHPDWHSAFAALPDVRPPADSWERLAARLEATDASHPVPRPLLRRLSALAAAAVLAVPMAWWLSRGPAANSPVAPTAGRTAPAAILRPATAQRDAPVPEPATAMALEREPVRRPHPQTPRPIRDGGTRDAVAVAPPRIPTETTPAPMAVSAATTALSGPPGEDALASSGVADGTDLRALHDESARLEALVAQARDPRMASAPALLMTAALDERLRMIDAALSQPGTHEDVRAELWNERVDALRELASLEGTQRWMAAHGEPMDAITRVD